MIFAHSRRRPEKLSPMTERTPPGSESPRISLEMYDYNLPARFVDVLRMEVFG